QAALVAWWPLDSDGSDASGNGHDAVVVGTGVNAGQAGANAATGQSTDFTGTGHLDVPWASALNTESFTVALWANPDAAGGGSFRSPITNRDDVSPGGAFRHGFIIYNTNNGQWSFWNGGGTAGNGAWNNVNVGPVTVNEWSHLAITYDASTNTKQFFLNGALVSTTNPVAYSPNNSTILDGFTHEDEDLHIGGGGDAGTSFRFDGRIDDVGMWDEVLSEVEIQSVMNNGIGGGEADPNLVTRGSYNLTFDGIDGTFSIPINNIGETQDLTITGAPSIGGADAANFSVVTVPGPIAPGASANLVCSFDPLGVGGLFEATFDIASDDPLEPNKVVTVRMTFRNPFVSGPAAIDFGTLSSGAGAQAVQVTIENPGISQLDISDITLAGPDAGNFSLGAFTNIVGGGTIDVDLTFNSNGQEGSFVADLTIE
ncbi:MAG: LamG-like jellyroll fold domain-containing protein, partial [Verrucomicrobiota bacterium]|nr:LamG-like jellyroll fold domain-containing protein [Verrucomicrobiota bacterium]